MSTQYKSKLFFYLLDKNPKFDIKISTSPLTTDSQSVSGSSDTEQE